MADFDSAFGGGNTSSGDVYSDLSTAVSSGAVRNPFEDYPCDKSALRAWDAEHEEQLSQKQRASGTAKAKRVEDGKAALSAIVAERAKALEERRKANRADQEDFVAKRDSTTAGNSWERVGGMVDLKAAREGKDVSRMRATLIQLKQHPVPTQPAF